MDHTIFHKWLIKLIKTVSLCFSDFIFPKSEVWRKDLVTSFFNANVEISSFLYREVSSWERKIIFIFFSRSLQFMMMFKSLFLMRCWIILLLVMMGHASPATHLLVIHPSFYILTVFIMATSTTFLFDRIFVCGYVSSWYMCVCVTVCMQTHGE